MGFFPNPGAATDRASVRPAVKALIVKNAVAELVLITLVCADFSHRLAEAAGRYSSLSLLERRLLPPKVRMVDLYGVAGKPRLTIKKVLGLVLGMLAVIFGGRQKGG